MNDVAIPTNARQAAERQAAGPARNLLTQIAERLGGTASVAAVYGTPIERDGTTIVPVARVSWGFGAGSGTGSGEQGSGVGEGGGGGASASPVGYIEMRNGMAEFRPIRMRPPALAVAPMLVAAGLASALFLHSLRRLLRG